MPLSQYQMATPGVTQFGQVANQIAIGLARQKYMMEQQRQEMAMKQAELASQMMHQRAQEALYGAQKEAEGAQGEHYKAQTAQIQNEDNASQALGNALRGMAQYGTAPSDREEGPFEATARNANLQQQRLNTIQQMGILSGMGRQRVPENVAQIQESDNPMMRAIMAAGGADKLYHNVPAGATAISPVPGVNAVMGGVTLPQGANLMAPQAIDFHQLLNGQMPQRQKVAEGQPKALNTSNDPRLREMGTLGAFIRGIAPGGMEPEPGTPVYGNYTNAAARFGQLMQNPGSPVQPQTLPPDALPMPKSKMELKQGQVYQTSRGPATWDGEKFNQ